MVFNDILKFLVGLILIGCGIYFLVREVKNKILTFNDITMLGGSIALIITGFFLSIRSLLEFLT
jgi:hypothetical protein